MTFLKYLWIHDKFSSTGFKQRLPAEFHGNNYTLIIIFFRAAWRSKSGLGADLLQMGPGSTLG